MRNRGGILTVHLRDRIARTELRAELAEFLRVDPADLARLEIAGPATRVPYAYTPRTRGFLTTIEVYAGRLPTADSQTDLHLAKHLARRFAQDALICPPDDRGMVYEWLLVGPDGTTTIVSEVPSHDDEDCIVIREPTTPVTDGRGNLGIFELSNQGKNVYESPSYAGAQALHEAMEANDAEALGSMIIGAALHEEDFDTVYRACVKLSAHPDEVVRGNALLGLGHLARLFGRLGDDAPQLVKNGLDDASEYVRGQAHAAAGDLKHFLGIEIDAASEGA